MPENKAGRGVQEDPVVRQLIEDAAKATELFTDDELEQYAAKRELLRMEREAMERGG
jgi:hypothetical protein